MFPLCARRRNCELQKCGSSKICRSRISSPFPPDTYIYILVALYATNDVTSVMYRFKLIFEFPKLFSIKTSLLSREMIAVFVNGLNLSQSRRERFNCRRESGRSLNLDPFFPGAYNRIVLKVHLNKEIVIQKSCKLEKTFSPSVELYSLMGTKGLKRSSFHFVRLTFIRFVQVQFEL